MNGEIRQKRTLGDDGEWVLTPEYVLGGKIVSEAEYHAALPEGTGAGVVFSNAITNSKPMKSDSLAIHSKQRAAVMARNAKRGLVIPYDKHGRPVFTDAGQRKSLMKIESEAMQVKIVKQNSYDGY